MGLNNLPSSERAHISFFGRRNAGKSSVVNAVTGQKLSIVSDKLGTTTDPVTKAMEILPMGPVVIIDTPGFDDEGELGELRVEKAKQVLNKTDVAVLIIDVSAGMKETDKELISLFKEKEIPYITVYNKCDTLEEVPADNGNTLYVSALTGSGIHELKEKIASFTPDKREKFIVRDLIEEKDLVVLVIPIDESAPKGRIILPQQQTLREVLDTNAVAVCVQDTDLKDYLATGGKKPKMVITDSQAFKLVSDVVPEDIPLTSFSILLARYKGFLIEAVKGVSALKELKEGSCILVAEGCTHHRQCNDIGTVKLPNMIRKFTGKDFIFETVSGREFPDNLSKYDLVLHCGGCMLNDREVQNRMKSAVSQGIPFTNYGITIAYLTGILKRSLELFPELTKLI